MALNARVTLPGKPETSNLHTLSVQEDATPTDPSSSSGGVGSISLSVDDFAYSRRLHGTVLVADNERGKTSGIVRSVSSTDGVLSVEADSALGRFNADMSAPPYSGTLGGAMTAYCALAGVTNNLYVDPTLASIPVVNPGWYGNMWVELKRFLSTHNAEISLVFDRIVVRPLRTVTAVNDYWTTMGETTDNENAAQRVEVYNYNNEYGSQIEVYPWVTANPSIIVVGADEVVEVTQRLEASLVSVNQPDILAFVGPDLADGTTGHYSVVGADGLPVQPAQWTDAGGLLTVTLTEDPSVVTIRVSGARIPHLAPFRIAMSSGASTYYNSLHITGDGVRWDKELVSFTTGADTPNEVGVTLDSPFIGTLERAHDVGVRVSRSYGGLNHGINGAAYTLNRPGSGLEFASTSIAVFNAFNAGETVAQFNTSWSGTTITQFNTYWDNRAADAWENQLFGNAVGARIIGDRHIYRVNTSITDPSSVGFVAVSDVIIGDFNTAHSGMTVAQFNTKYVGHTVRDFSLVPL